jgi:endonuclease YncB( thermonuclease family)
MKRTIIFTIVAGLLVLLNGWIANVASPAFRLPDSVAEDITNKIDGIDFDTSTSSAVVVEERGMVTRVIDGDTIEVEFLDGELALVRYIGVDTPEQAKENTPAECFYQEATRRNEELVAGREVRLVRDVSSVDQYGRLLRYVYVGEDFINLRLVAEGYAEPVTFPPDVAKVEEFRQVEIVARNERIGLWAYCRE